MQAIQLFTSALLDSAGIDYHVVLAQNALHQCLSLTELQPELICALIKQTSRVQPQSQQAGVAGVGSVGSKWSGGQVNRSALHKMSKPAKQSTHVSGACVLFLYFTAQKKIVIGSIDISTQKRNSPQRF